MLKMFALSTMFSIVFFTGSSLVIAQVPITAPDEIAFDFNNAADYQDWGKINRNLSAKVRDGEMVCTVESDNESGGLYCIVPLSQPINASMYPILEARIKTNKNYQFQLYWLDDVDETWEFHSILAQLRGGMRYDTYVKDLSKSGKWRNRITHLRFGLTTYQAAGAPQVKKGDVLILDYIKFKKINAQTNSLVFLNLWEQEKVVARLYDKTLQKKVNYKGKLLDESGKVVTSFKGTEEGNGMVEITFSTKGIIPDKYTLQMEVFGVDGTKLVERSTPFEKLSKPVWLKTSGERQVTEVPLPWTPLKTADREISCIMRSYRFQNLPFPSQIISKNMEMLAAPITLKGSIDGKEIEWGKGKFEFTDKKDYKVSYQTSCQGNMADINGKCYVEFDGMIWFEFTLNVKDPHARLDSLYLDIPLKKMNSLYYWLGGGSWDTYKSGVFVQKPETKKFIFFPYVSVADDERGLCWFTESDENWNYTSKDAIELIDQKDQNIVRINLVNVPYIPDKSEIKFAFGLQATPVKPYPRNIDDHPGRYAMTDHHSGTGFYNYDKELLAQKYKIRTIAAGILADRVMDFAPGPGERFSRNKKTISEYEKMGIKLLPYTCLSNINIKDEELLRYGDEWMGMTDGKWDIRPLGVMYEQYPDFYPVSQASESWHDYFLWKMEQAIDKFGVQGVYLDCSDPDSCWNPYLGCGYVGRNGEIKPTVTIRKSRELMKRLYALKKKKKNFLIEFHMSTFPVVPTHAFADMYMDGEQFISKPEFFELSLEKFRAEFMGQPWGIPCNLWVFTLSPGMPGFFDNEKALAFTILHGTQFNMEPSLLFFERFVRLNDVMDKFQVNRAELYPYWKSRKAVRLDTKEAEANVYKKSGEALVVLSNLRKNNLNVTVELDLNALGLSGELYAKDYLENQFIRIDKNKFVTSLTTENRVKLFHVGSKDKLNFVITPQPTVAEFMGDYSKSNFPEVWDQSTTVKEFINNETSNADNRFARLSFDLPATQQYKRIYWGLEVRLSASKPQGDGMISILRPSVNGKILTDTEGNGKGNLVGKTGKSFHLASGLLCNWYDPQRQAWAVSAFPGFSLPTEKRLQFYRPVHENPFTYVFDITNLVRPGENTLSVIIDKKLYAGDVFFKTIAIKASKE